MKALLLTLLLLPVIIAVAQILKDMDDDLIDFD